MENRTRDLMPCENICMAFRELGVSACEGCCRRDRALTNNKRYCANLYWVTNKNVHALVRHLYKEKEVCNGIYS